MGPPQPIGPGAAHRLHTRSAATVVDVELACGTRCGTPPLFEVLMAK